MTVSISPTVHATDRRSIVETLEIQGQVVRQGRVSANDLPIVVSSVGLDEHVGTPFADAWTFGSVASLVRAGAASLTYAHAEPVSRSRLRAEKDRASVDVEVSPPGRIAALATSRGLLMANLTSEPRMVQGRRRGGPTGVGALRGRICGFLVMVAHAGDVLQHAEARAPRRPSGSSQMRWCYPAPTARSRRWSRRAAVRARASGGRTAEPHRPGSGSSRRRRPTGGTARPA